MFRTAGSRAASVTRLLSRTQSRPSVPPSLETCRRLLPKVVPQFVPLVISTQQQHYSSISDIAKMRSANTLNTKGSEVKSERLETSSRTVFIDFLSNFAVRFFIKLQHVFIHLVLNTFSTVQNQENVLKVTTTTSKARNSVMIPANDFEAVKMTLNNLLEEAQQAIVRKKNQLTQNKVKMNYFCQPGKWR